MVEQAMRKSEVLALLREHKPMMTERFGVVELALFGSTIRDEARPDSDVDILVSFDRPTRSATAASSSTSRTCLAGPSTSSRTRHCARSCARMSRPRRFVSENRAGRMGGGGISSGRSMTPKPRGTPSH